MNKSIKLIKIISVKISKLILIVFVSFNLISSALAKTEKEIAINELNFNQFTTEDYTIKMIKKSENLIAKSKPKNQKNTPPSEVINAIKKDITNRFNINQNKIEVKESHQKTWFDGCLELAKPDEFCTQALVEGWRIILQNNDKTWIYRTNNNGSIIRLE